MGWLDDLLGSGLGGGRVPPAEFPWDQPQMTQDAREAAAARMARQMRPGRGEPAPASSWLSSPTMGTQEEVPFAPGVGILNQPQMSPAGPQRAPLAPEPLVPPVNDDFSRAPVSEVNGERIATAQTTPDKPEELKPEQPSGQPEGPAGTAPLPAGATPVALPPAPAAPPAPQPSGLGNVGNILGKIFAPENAPLLLAMGGGFAGAPSFGSGMGRAFTAAAPQAALLQQERLKLEPQAANEKAMLARGVPPDLARAASMNKDLFNQIAPTVFGAKQRDWVQIGENFDGSKIWGWVDKAAGKVYDLSGKELTGGDSAAAPGGSTLLAKGVTQYDPQLQGDDYIKQFSPEMQAAIKARLRGDVQPTGNPRQKGFETKANEFARTYADQVGLPYSDALYSERRKFRTDLGSTSPSTVGGQAKAFNQGTAHLADLANELKRLGNWDPVGIPKVADFANKIRQMFSTDTSAISDKASAIGQVVAGEVGKLFSGSAGGGVHERQLTRDRFDTVKSPKQLAAALEATVEMMEGGLAALEQRRDAIFGAKGPNNPHNDIEFVSAATRKNIDHINDVIAGLRGHSVAPAATEVPAAPAAPKLKKGQTTTINGVTITKVED